MRAAVSLQGVTVRFGAVTALEGVDLEVEAGTLHAVVGENGAGKTTLMRVLYGAQRASEGRVFVEGQERRFRGSKDAIAAGVGMVSQHYAIIPEMTALENLMLGAEGGGRPAGRRRAGGRRIWRADGVRVRLGPSGGGAGSGGAQKLEILKLLWREARVMILDEPTAMLSPADGEALFGSLRTLVDAGATVILVTHRLPEVIDHGSRVTVLRAGRRVAEMAVAETDARELAGLIVGGGGMGFQPMRDTAFQAVSLQGQDAPGTHGLEAHATLKIDNLTVRDARGHDALRRRR